MQLLISGGKPKTEVPINIMAKGNVNQFVGILGLVPTTNYFLFLFFIFGKMEEKKSIAKDY